jgi:predicted NBD/HSP70 family sugar kinase
MSASVRVGGATAAPTAGRATSDGIRRHNAARVLRAVHLDGPLSRAELTQRLALSRSTVGGLVGDLVALGLVEESVPVGGLRAGRPSHVVAPRRGGPYVVAVDIEVDRLTTAAVTVGGSPIDRQVSPLGEHARSPAAVARTIAESVGRLARTEGQTAFAIGVSIPGTVRVAEGVIEVAPNLGWRDVRFRQALADVLPGMPVALANDADLGVLAEHLRGAARDADNVVYLAGKVGVGAGILVDGKALRGAGGLAGEIGHTVLDPDGEPCHCGGRGCVEQLIGEAALIREAGWPGPADPEAVAAVLAAARSGDVPAARALSRVARALGQVLANLVNVLNPQVVVLSGALTSIFEAARDQVVSELDRQAMAAARAMVDVRMSGLGADSSLVGAAELAFHDLLADPLGVAAR